jgi:hypothetical protein
MIGVQEDLEDMDLDDAQQLLEAVAKSSEAEAKTALADLEKEKAIQVWFGFGSVMVHQLN